MRTPWAYTSFTAPGGAPGRRLHPQPQDAEDFVHAALQLSHAVFQLRLHLMQIDMHPIDPLLVSRDRMRETVDGCGDPGKSTSNFSTPK